MAQTTTTTTTTANVAPVSHRTNTHLKMYVRFDGNKNLIAGSNILARKKPKLGNWIEIPVNECCNPTTSTTTTVDRNPN